MLPPASLSYQLLFRGKIEAEQNLTSHCFKASGTFFFAQKHNFQICWVLLREGELRSAPRFSTLLHSSSRPGIPALLWMWLIWDPSRWWGGSGHSCPLQEEKLGNSCLDDRENPPALGGHIGTQIYLVAKQSLSSTIWWQPIGCPPVLDLFAPLFPQRGSGLGWGHCCRTPEKSCHGSRQPQVPFALPLQHISPLGVTLGPESLT